MAITPVPDVDPVPAFPVFADRATGTYNTKGAAWALHMATVFVAQIVALVTSAFNNAQAALGFANDAAASAASAANFTNFKGLWGSLSGAQTTGATVLENNAYWVLLEDIADVTLEQPGVSTKWAPKIMQAQAIGAADLNALANGGSYAVASPTNGPVGVVNAIVNVTRGSTVMVQELIDSDAGVVWHRTAKDLLGTPTYSAWGRVSHDNDAGVALGGGAMDCSKGTYFTESISANRTLAFTNIPTGAYACVLEITHTGGTITLPAGSVWVGGAAPTLYTPKRHLYYFQKALTGSGGWIVSALPNSAP